MNINGHILYVSIYIYKYLYIFLYNKFNENTTSYNS